MFFSNCETSVLIEPQSLPIFSLKDFSQKARKRMSISIDNIIYRYCIMSPTTQTLSQQNFQLVFFVDLKSVFHHHEIYLSPQLASYTTRRYKVFLSTTQMVLQLASRHNIVNIHIANIEKLLKRNQKDEKPPPFAPSLETYPSQLATARTPKILIKKNMAQLLYQLEKNQSAS